MNRETMDSVLAFGDKYFAGRDWMICEETTNNVIFLSSTLCVDVIALLCVPAIELTYAEESEIGDIACISPDIWRDGDMPKNWDISRMLQFLAAALPSVVFTRLIELADEENFADVFQGGV